MPCKSSVAYSVSFHPSIDEYREYETLFKDQFVKTFRSDRYILTKEKGKREFFTHYQGVIEFDKEKRADTFRNTFHKKVMASVEVDNLKIALKITPITRDINMCRGYCLKEIPVNNMNFVESNYDLKRLLEFQAYYKEYQKSKLLAGDTVRVSKRNIHIIFKRYYEQNQDKYRERLLHRKTVDRKTVIKILSDMTNDGYWIGNILLSRELSKTIDFLWKFINNKIFEFIADNDGEQQSIIQDKMDQINMRG